MIMVDGPSMGEAILRQIEFRKMSVIFIGKKEWKFYQENQNKKAFISTIECTAFASANCIHSYVIQTLL